MLKGNVKSDTFNGNVKWDKTKIEKIKSELHTKKLTTKKETSSQIVSRTISVPGSIVWTNPTTTFVIDTPGTYYMTSNFAFVGGTETVVPYVGVSKPAIRIQSNNVVVEMRGYTLSYSGSTPNTYGIRVGSDLLSSAIPSDPIVYKNITIDGKTGGDGNLGQINDFTAAAIGSLSINVLVGIPGIWENIQVLDIDINRCGTLNAVSSSLSDDYTSVIGPWWPLTSGVEFFGLNGVFGGELDYQNIIIRNVNIYDSEAGAINQTIGIRLGFGYIVLIGQGVVIEDCNVERCIFTDSGQFGGVMLLLGESSVPSQSTVNNCMIKDITGYSIDVFDTSNSYDTTITNCIINNISADDVANIMFTINSTNITINNISSNDLSADRVTCLLIINSIDTIISNISCTNFNGRFTTRGITPAGSTNTTINNITIDSLSSSDGNCNGIDGVRMTNLKITNSSFTNITGPGGFVGGIFFSDVPNSIISSDILIKNCIFKNIVGSYGIFAKATRDMVVEDCSFSSLTEGPDKSGIDGIVILSTTAEGPPGDETLEQYNSGNVIVRKCKFKNIQSVEEFSNATGISCSLSNSLWEDTDLGLNALKNVTIEYCSFKCFKSLNKSYGVWVRRSNTPPLINPIGEIENIIVKCCKFSEIYANLLSYAIEMHFVKNPQIKHNKIKKCGNGILLTGTDNLIPNGFRLSETINDALADPPQLVHVTGAANSNLHSFTNTINSTTANVKTSLVKTSADTFYPNEIIQALQQLRYRFEDELEIVRWETGQSVVYNNNGNPDIEGLVNGQTYYIIVYSPGFSRDGIVCGNTVKCCDGFGFKDDQKPTTNKYRKNIAINNSPNYDVYKIDICKADKKCKCNKKKCCNKSINETN